MRRSIMSALPACSSTAGSTSSLGPDSSLTGPSKQAGGLSLAPHPLHSCCNAREPEMRMFFALSAKGPNTPTSHSR